MIRILKKYLSIMKSYFNYSIMLEFEYKVNFFFGGTFELLWLIMYVLLMEVIFSGTNSIGNWTKYEVLFLTFQGGLTDAVVSFTIVPALIQIPNHVVTGKLDYYLLKPVNNRFICSLNNFALAQVWNVLVNIAGVIYCCYKLNIQLTAGRIAVYLLFCIISFLIIYCIMLSMLSLAFWVMKMDLVMSLCTELITVGNKPYSIYPKLFVKILVYVLPILVAFNFPVISMVRNGTADITQMFFIALAMLAVWWVISECIFRKGVERYVGTGN